MQHVTINHRDFNWSRCREEVIMEGPGLNGVCMTHNFPDQGSEYYRKGEGKISKARGMR